MGVGAGLYMCDVVKKVHVRYLISWWVLVRYMCTVDPRRSMRKNNLWCDSWGKIASIWVVWARQMAQVLLVCICVTCMNEYSTWRHSSALRTNDVFNPRTTFVAVCYDTGISTSFELWRLGHWTFSLLSTQDGAGSERLFVGKTSKATDETSTGEMSCGRNLHKQTT